MGYRGIVGLGYVSISPTPGTYPQFPPHAPLLHPSRYHLHNTHGVYPLGVGGVGAGRAAGEGMGVLGFKEFTSIPREYRVLLMC